MKSDFTNKEIMNKVEDHTKDDEARFSEIAETQKRILEILEPMALVFNGYSFTGNLLATIMRTFALFAAGVAGLFYLINKFKG